ncbi:MAG: ribonuclease H-like domain-containing protein [Candidatus Nanohaloarchaea archaeon]
MRIENSFILAPGIGEKTEKKLWRNGFTHWDHIDECDLVSENRRQKTIDFLEKARTNLEVGNTVFFGDKLPSGELWRMYENFRDNVCFFDIETTGLDASSNKVTTVSFHRGGEDVTLVRGQDLTRERLKKELFESSMLVSFNGKRFDQPFLEKSFGIDMETPHLDLMYTCRRLGISGGLKEVEKKLGIQRELEDIDGREAIRLWKRYERKDDEDALDKLVKYNRYDAKNLKKLLSEAHSRLEQETYRKHLQ